MSQDSQFTSWLMALNSQQNETFWPVSGIWNRLQREDDKTIRRKKKRAGRNHEMNGGGEKV